jgi:agmatine deiminase
MSYDSSDQAKSPNTDSCYHFPAEFEPQQAVWIVWPNYQGIAESSGCLPEEPVTIDMVKALAPHVHVKLVIESQGALEKVERKLQNKRVQINNVSFQIIPYVDIGIRDWGPIYIIDDMGGKRILHFNFTNWGLPQYADPHEMATCNIFALRAANKYNLPIFESKIVSEGGDRSFNGKGTMMTIENTELNRNPGWTKEELEAEYKRILSVRKVVWLKRGVVDDNEPNEASLPGPNGKNNAYAIGAEHVDEVAHFADAHTILLAWVTEEESRKDPIAAINQQRLLENYERLIAATDQDGNPFKIIKVPIAETMYYPLNEACALYQWIRGMEFLDGSSFPAPGNAIYELVPTSYMNIIVCNGTVVVPKYWTPGMPDAIKKKDAQVGIIMQEAFLGRSIVRINPLAYNIGSGGGMHCSFQQEPPGLK